MKLPLLEKLRLGEKRASGRRYIFSQKPLYRRRRRLALLALCVPLLLISAWFLASFFAESPTEVATGPVSRMSIPEIQKAPEILADLEFRKQPAYEGETNGQRSATREAKGEKASGEKQGAPAPPEDPTLYMTVPRLGVYNHTVRNDDSEWALDQGAIKLPPPAFRGRVAQTLTSPDTESAGRIPRATISSTTYPLCKTATR